MSDFELIATLPVRNILGECITWDSDTESVWWTDIHGRQLYRYWPSTKDRRRYAVPERLCSFGLIENDARLICAFDTGFALFDPESGRLEWLYQPEEQFRGTRFNDGRVDRAGRFWAGTMVEGDDPRDAEGSPVKGSLYCISTAGSRRALGDIGISNGLAFSPDGRTLYFADSPTRQILAFDLDAATGKLGQRRVFARLDGPGVPDGSTVDAEGFLWNAEWGGSRITRYTPGGAVALRCDVPVTQPTCLCFGGPDLKLLFVTTATEGLSDASLGAQPEAGNVLIYRTPFQGISEARYLA